MLISISMFNIINYRCCTVFLLDKIEIFHQVDGPVRKYQMQRRSTHNNRRIDLFTKRICWLKSMWVSNFMWSHKWKSLMVIMPFKLTFKYLVFLFLPSGLSEFNYLNVDAEQFHVYTCVAVSVHLELCTSDVIEG